MNFKDFGTALGRAFMGLLAILTLGIVVMVIMLTIMYCVHTFVGVSVDTAYVLTSPIMMLLVLSLLVWIHWPQKKE